MRRTRMQYKIEVERDAVLCPMCKGTGEIDDSIYGCPVCRESGVVVGRGRGRLTVAEWEAYKADLRERYAAQAAKPGERLDWNRMAEDNIRRHEGGRKATRRMRIPQHVREWMEGLTLDMLDSSYRHYYKVRALAAADGYRYGTLPSWTVTAVMENLDAYCNAPEVWQDRSRRRKLSWTRSMLDRLVKDGKLHTVLGLGMRGREVRCYEPTEEAQQAMAAEAKVA